MKFYMMKGSFLSVLITVLLLSFDQCAPAKPANEPGTSSAARNTASEEPDRELSRAFAEAGLPLFRQRVASMDFSASPADAEGLAISLTELKGKVVFLNFWATWCGPCRAEMPSMEALYRRFREKGLEILAVNHRENKKTVDAFTEQFGLSFPITLDPSGRINGIYGVSAFPTTYIIDREGMILTRVVGSLDWNTPEIFSLFETLLDS